MSSEPSDFDDYNVGQHSMHPVDIPDCCNCGGEVTANKEHKCSLEFSPLVKGDLSEVSFNATNLDNRGDEGNHIIDIPTDQHEEIDEAIRQAHKGNSHTAINLLAEVVRGLL